MVAAREPCPECGSTNRKYFDTLRSEISVRSMLNWKHQWPGAKRPVAEGVSGSERSQSSGRWMRKKRLIDRENDLYEEMVVDEESGEVVHENHEPLSEHRGHGSGKNRRPANESVTPDECASAHEPGSNDDV